MQPRRRGNTAISAFQIWGEGPNKKAILLGHSFARDWQELRLCGGNPNFLNTVARRGFAKLMDFAVDACLDLKDDVAVRPHKTAIYHALLSWLQYDESEGEEFLQDALAYAIENLHIQPDELVYELVDGILGDFYPSPPRIIPNIERIAGKYLSEVLFEGDIDPSEFDCFATEGGTAGMVYAFKSLEENFLLRKGETVAIATPIFSPYLEIPQLNDFRFKVVSIEADENDKWQIPEDQIKKLEDHSIKVLYMVNPTNPTAVALDHETVDRIEEVVEKDNPELIILIDAVYATFVGTFHSLIERLPRNCLVVYSFSKYFGATGWRLGAMMLQKDNVIDQRIAELSKAQKKKLEKRYRIVSEDVEAIPFIERLVLDSRDVALAHTAGLSCPQQVMMSLFCLYDLLHRETYKKYVRGLVDSRIAALYEPLPKPITYPQSEYATHYYALIDILEVAEAYEKGLGRYMNQTFYPVDFVYCLAIAEGCVCLPGYGFFEEEKAALGEISPKDRNNWSIRVSLANLTQECGETEYSDLGKRIMDVIDEYKKDRDSTARSG